MKRWQTCLIALAGAVVSTVGTMALVTDTPPLSAHSLNSCTQARVTLYEDDGLDPTSSLGTRCIAVGGDGVWVWDLQTYGLQNRVESAVYRTGSPSWADCFRFTLFDGTTHLSDVTLGLDRDYHLELPASLDNRADWLGVTDCT